MCLDSVKYDGVFGLCQIWRHIWAMSDIRVCFGLCQIWRCVCAVSDMKVCFAGTGTVCCVRYEGVFCRHWECLGCVRYEDVFCRHWECLGCVRSMPLLTTCALTCPVTSSTCSSAALFCWPEASLLVLLPWQLPWAVSLWDCCCKAVDFTQGASQCAKSLWSLQRTLVRCESPLWSAFVGRKQCVNHHCGQLL